MIQHTYKCDFCYRVVDKLTASHSFLINTTIGDVLISVAYTKKADSIICRSCAVTMLQTRTDELNAKEP